MVEHVITGRPAVSTRDDSACFALRLDEESKACVAKAAALRRMSTNDYAVSVVVAQARRDVAEGEANAITLSPEEQLQFWNALTEAPELTEAQRRLGAVVRGER